MCLTNHRHPISRSKLSVKGTKLKILFEERKGRFFIEWTLLIICDGLHSPPIFVTLRFFQSEARPPFIHCFLLLCSKSINGLCILIVLILCHFVLRAYIVSRSYTCKIFTNLCLFVAFSFFLIYICIILQSTVLYMPFLLFSQSHKYVNDFSDVVHALHSVRDDLALLFVAVSSLFYLTISLLLLLILRAINKNGK